MARGDDPGLAQAQRAVAQRRLRAGQAGVQVPRRARQLIGAEPGLPQRVRDLVRGELRVPGLRVPPGQLGDDGELAGGGVGLDPVPRAQMPTSSASDTPANRSSSAAASAATASCAQPGSTSKTIPGPNAAAGLDDSPGKTRAEPGWPGPRRPELAASTASSSSAAASRISASSSAVKRLVVPVFVRLVLAAASSCSQSPVQGCLALRGRHRVAVQPGESSSDPGSAGAGDGGMDHHPFGRMIVLQT